MRHLLPVLFVIGSSFGVALAGAVGVLMLTMGPCGMSGGTVTTWLVYDIDTTRLPKGKEVSPRDVVAVLDRRLAPTWLRRKGQAKVAEGDRIELGLFNVKERDINETTANRLGATGLVEFRVLADANLHGLLVRQAQASRQESVHDKAGKLIARWIDVADDSGVLSEMAGNFIQRTVPGGDSQKVQLLVVEDDRAPSGNIIQSAAATTNHRVRLTFTPQGAESLKTLTANSNAMMSGWPLNLAMTVDGKLVGVVPNHQIDSTVELTGRYDETEANELADLINAGPLPAPLKYSGLKKR